MCTDFVITCQQVVRPRRAGQAQAGFTMRAPGALHHARFLASCLYILKLVMLRNVLPQGLVTPAMMESLLRMAQYIALFHGPWFLQGRIPAVAPRLDLELWTDMCLYEVKCLYILSPGVTSII